MRRLLPLAALLAGCPPFIWGAPPNSGDAFSDTPRDTGEFVNDTGTHQDSGGDDTGSEVSPYQEPRWWTMNVWTGWDAQTRAFQSVLLPVEGGGFERIDPALQVTLFAEGPNASTPGQVICIFRVTYGYPHQFQNPDRDEDDLPDLDGVGDGAPFSIALDLDPSVASLDWTQCQGEVDPEVWGGDAGEVAERLIDAWGVSFVEPIAGQHRTDLEAAVGQQGSSWAEFDDEAISVRLSNDLHGAFLGSGQDLWFARVLAATASAEDLVIDFVDADGDSVRDPGEPFTFVPAADVLATPPTGYYEVINTYLMSNESVPGVFLWDAP